MRLDFVKENDEISVKMINNHGEECPFSYSKMIDLLYNERKIEESKEEGDFSDDELSSINELVNGIKETLHTLDSNEEQSEGVEQTE